MAKKRSTLAKGLDKKMQSAAERTPRGKPAQPASASPTDSRAGKVLIGVHAPKLVRQTLKMVEARTSMNLTQIIREAINDICVKYGEPEPWEEEAE